MSGLEKIIGHISEEASEKAAILIADAEKKAEAVKNETVRKAAAEIDRIEKKADAEVSGIEERANASAELRRKQILLAGKQEIMDDVVKEAKKASGSSDRKGIRRLHRFRIQKARAEGRRGAQTFRKGKGTSFRGNA